MAFRKKMKFIALVLAISLTGAAASTSLLDTNKSFQVAIVELARDTIVATIKSSLKCDMPGDFVQPGTYCNENGHIHAFNAGVNYGLIERLADAGVPTEWIREQLADPANLRWIKDNFRYTLAEIVKSAVTGDSANFNIFSQDGLERGDYHFDKMDHLFERRMNEFIIRRLSEAKPEHKKEIAQLWAEIIYDQFQIFGENQKLVHSLKATD